MECQVSTAAAMTYLCLVSMGIVLSETNKDDCKRLNNYVSCYNNAKIRIWKESHSMQDGMYETRHATLIHAHFSAFNKSFHMILAQESVNNTILSKDVKINLISQSGEESVHMSENKIQEVYGYLLNNQDSTVRGIVVEDNYFFGVIETNDDLYYVERMSSNHSTIVYRERDIERWHLTLRNDLPHNNDTSKPRKAYVSVSFMTGGNSTGSKHSQRRETRSVSYSPIRSVCHLHVLFDHTFFQYRAGGSVTNTLSLMVNHIAESTSTFRRTDFNSDGLGDNIIFVVDKVTIFQTDTDVGYTLANSMDVDTYLETFSRLNFDQYCLGVIFTHRDFNGGVIGLAWMASSSLYDVPGGLCQKQIHYVNPVAYYNYNTLLVSTLNYGQTQPIALSSLTLVHEIGHSFGSPHDSDSCLPGGLYGNYIMSALASDGNKPNNVEFSACSKQYINPVVVNKGSCLELLNDDLGVCGDGIIDQGEHCDCGSIAECLLNNQCCNPPGVNGCTFAVGYTCSPRVSGCCNASCTISPANTICVGETECSLESVCGGVDPECPVPEQQPNGTSCEDNNGICHNGFCTRNLCLSLHLTQCQCLGSEGELCQLCCMVNSSCVSASSLGLLSPSGAVVYHTPGQPCNNYHGYCNQQMVCKPLETEYVVSNLKGFFSKNTAQMVIEWFQNYWYLLLLAICACSLLVIMFKARAVKHKSEPLISLAIQSGKMAVVWQKATAEKKLLKQDAEKLEDSFRDMLDREKHERSVEYDEAIARMTRFFPTVPQKQILYSVRISNNEENAVRLVLLKGFPMRVLHTEADEPIDKISTSS